MAKRQNLLIRRGRPPEDCPQRIIGTICPVSYLVEREDEFDGKH